MIRFIDMFLLVAVLWTNSAFEARLPATDDSRPDAVSLLRMASQRYEQAKYYRFEITGELEFSSELSGSWSKTFNTAILAPGNRYRFEERTFTGGLAQISDGKTEWIYQSVSRQYTRRAAPVPGPSHFEEPMFAEQQRLENTHDVAKRFSELLKNLRSPVYAANETIAVHNTPLAYFVVRGEGRYRSRWGPDVLSEFVLWIDKQVLLIRRMHVHTHGRSRILAGRPRAVEDHAVTFEVAEVNGLSVENGVFAFTPPPGAKQVKKLKDPARSPTEGHADQELRKAARPENGDAEAEALLRQVSEEYAGARYYQVEAVHEFREEGDLWRNWSKDSDTAAVGPENKYRLQKNNDWLPKIQVSDGHTEWIYRPDLQEYIERPAGASAQRDVLLTAGRIEAMQAAHTIAELANGVQAAVYLPEQTLVINGQTLICRVVQAESKDTKTKLMFWIEKNTLIVRKVQSATRHFYRAGGGEAIGTSVTTYSTVTLNLPADSNSAKLFQFSPPAGAKLVEKFSDRRGPPELVPR